jgi:chromosome segregation ATPase
MDTANSTTPAGASPSTPGHITGEQGSIVEPRPIVETVNNDEIFLSPRVLDAGAFARYSEMLKSIITQAGTQARTLEDYTTDAEAMIKRCNESGEAINKRMQAGVRMIKMIDERAERTDRLLEHVQAALPDSQALADQIDQLIETRLAESERRFEELSEQAQAKVNAAEKRTQEAIEISDAQANKLADLSAKVDFQLGELDAKIDHTRVETSETLSGMIEQSNTARDELGAVLDQVLARAQEAGANLALKIDEASNLTDARIAQLNQSIEPVLEASTMAMKTLGMDPENPVFEDSPLSRIEQLVDRGETQLASLDRVYRQLEDLQSQAEGVKSVFGLWLVDAAKDLDTLEERKDTLVGPMSEAADKIAKLGPDLEDKLELASTELTHLQIEQKALRQTIQASSSIANDVTEKMTNQSGQLQALLDGSLHKLSTRVEQAGIWLGALIQRAESLGGTLPGAGTMEFGRAQPEPIATRPMDTTQTITGQTISEPPTPPAFNLATDTPSIEIPRQPMTQEPIAQEPATLVSPQPPCLPIDALSFDGAGMVIEHEPTAEHQED